VLANAPVFRNNIVMNCTWTAKSFSGSQNGVTTDHNLYANCGGAAGESGAVYADPQFVANGSDWHLRSGSPAIGAGVAVSFTLWGGGSVPVGVTRDGQTRDTWNIGAY
jgi:hypothetical protein